MLVSLATTQTWLTNIFACENQTMFLKLTSQMSLSSNDCSIFYANFGLKLPINLFKYEKFSNKLPTSTKLNKENVLKPPRTSVSI